MKGILLCGGTGSRLYPITTSTNKHLLPIFDKPMVYYSLSVLLLANIREVLIITRPEDRDAFLGILGDGSTWGISLIYAVQKEPKGIAQALTIGESFLEGGPCALMLGDNLFFGQDMTQLLKNEVTNLEGATIFSYWVQDSSRFGVVTFNPKTGVPTSLEEKPTRPRSHYAVTGLYFYDSTASEKVRNLKPSARGELEITDLNRLYLEEERLRAVRLRRGFAWLDTGTAESLHEAAQFAHAIEHRQGLKIACPEEIVWRQGWIDDQAFITLINTIPESAYRDYLERIHELERSEGTLDHLQ